MPRCAWATGTSTPPQMYGNEREIGEGLRASGRQARRRVRHHQGLARQAARRRFRALGRRKPERARAAVGRSAADPLAEHGGAARGDHRRAVQDEARGQDAACRRRQFHRRVARRGRQGRDEPLVTNQIEVHPFIDRSKVIDGRRASTACRSRPIARSRAARCRATRCSARIGKRTARARRRCRCASWCSRASSRSRAPPIRSS